MTARNPKEIEILWEGGKKLAACLEEVKRAVRAGVKTGDLDALAEKLIVKSGGRPSFKGYGANGTKNPFPASLCVSVNDEVVHGIPGGQKLRPGDIVGLDIGMEYGGFFTDMAATLGAGRASCREREEISGV